MDPVRGGVRFFASYSFALWMDGRSRRRRFFETSQEIRIERNVDSVPHFGHHSRLTSNCSQPEGKFMHKTNPCNFPSCVCVCACVCCVWVCVCVSEINKRTRATFQAFWTSSSHRLPLLPVLFSRPPAILSYWWRITKVKIQVLQWVGPKSLPY